MAFMPAREANGIYLTVPIRTSRKNVPYSGGMTPCCVENIEAIEQGLPQLWVLEKPRLVVGDAVLLSSPDPELEGHIIKRVITRKKYYGLKGKAYQRQYRYDEHQDKDNHGYDIPRLLQVDV